MINKEKKLFSLSAGIVLLVISTFLPVVRFFIINTLENFLLHKHYPNELWVNAFIMNGLFFTTFFVILCISIFKQIKFHTFFFILILISFIISNIFIIIKKKFTGYCNYWEYSDLLGCIEAYAKSDFFGTNYPPLCIVFYKILYLFFPKYGIDTVYILNYILFCFIMGTSIAAYCLFNILFDNTLQKKGFYSFILFLTGPFLFAYQRGNITIIAFICILFYLCFYSSKNKVLKELALLSLAIAANFKIFPAIFGAILLKERKWKEALRAFVYGIILFFLPFLIATCINKVNNLSNHQTDITQVADNTGTITRFAESSRRFASGDWIIEYSISLKAFVLRGVTKIKIFDSINNIIAMFMVCLSFVISMFCFFITKRKSYELLLLGFLCVLIPTSSFWYSLIYLIPGLIYYINEKTEWNYLSYFVNIFFVLIFIFCTGFSLFMPNGTMLHIILLWCIIIIDILYTYIKNKINRKTVA